ncbi:VENN motif pre-toxin domain-containing protein [Uruburuella testudinis]|uniref:VENN motif pre-toxin domain-containing protein n=1 Tax=Uruburuella testudinis TaxID=1282863 RepID=A0ABY4DRY4_9NEIS|nr:VENN motif pre-toxin domain-containing protein [Uruburuella testudinis]UOO80754.1 VENN motif pre-toxin domain-containing protein [Uruburuella testudinis]
MNNSENFQTAYNKARDWGIGGSNSCALNAASALITGALGDQTDIQVAANTLAPYASAAIGRQFGHGADKNEVAQAVSHFALGATLAYINGGNALSGGSAAVAAEKAAIYLSRQYDDGQTARDPVTGEFNPNLLPESVKDEIKSTTGVIAALVGATGDGGAALNTQIAGVIGQNAVENNQLSGYESLMGGNVGVESLKGAVSLYKQQLESGKTIEEANKEVNKYLQGYGLRQHTGVENLVYGSLALPIVAIGGKSYAIAALSSVGQGVITTVIIEGKPYKVSDLSYDASLGILVGKGLSKASESMFKWSNVRSDDLKANKIMKNSLIIPSLYIQYGVGKAGSGTASKFLEKRDIILIEVPDMRKNIQKK